MRAPESTENRDLYFITLHILKVLALFYFNYEFEYFDFNASKHVTHQAMYQQAKPYHSC